SLTTYSVNPPSSILPSISIVQPPSTIIRKNGGSRIHPVAKLQFASATQATYEQLVNEMHNDKHYFQNLSLLFTCRKKIQGEREIKLLTEICRKLHQKPSSATTCNRREDRPISTPLCRPLESVQYTLISATEQQLLILRHPLPSPLATTPPTNHPSPENLRSMPPLSVPISPNHQHSHPATATQISKMSTAKASRCCDNLT
ncbi:hypothetical protein RYX36_010436, partial [Vicia faba]